jgi:hypothetical protein
MTGDEHRPGASRARPRQHQQGKVSDVPEISSAKARLREATTVPGTLSASFDAFEVIRLLARGNEDRIPELFAAFMMVADAAVDGREAVTTAPSLPAAAGNQMPAATGGDAGEIADAMAALAVLLGERLGGAAVLADGPGDRAACEQAAAAAGRICQLMARGHDDSPLR